MLFSYFRTFLCTLLCLLPLTMHASHALTPPASPTPPSALLIVDMQNCFSPTGSLAVPAFLSLLPIINRLHSLPLFSLVALSQDYHPSSHVSFADNWPDAAPFTQRLLSYDSSGRLCQHPSLPPSLPALSPPCAADEPVKLINQTLWPTHCVAGRDDSAFHPLLSHWPSDVVVRKGQSATVDSYSAFTDVISSQPTTLPATLADAHISRLYVVGVAYEVCVAASVMDAIKAGLHVVVVEDAVAGVNPVAVAEKRAEMEAAGVQFVQSWKVPGWDEANVATVVDRTMQVEVAVQ